MVRGGLRRRHLCKSKRMSTAEARRFARRQWRLDSSVFQVFNRAYGPINLDARLGRRHPLEATYCERVANLEQYEVLPEDVMWSMPIADRTGSTLEFILSGAMAPGSRALLLLPKWTRSSWWPLTRKLTLLDEIGRGEPIFSRPGRRGEEIAVRTPWSMCLYEYRVPESEEGGTPSEDGSGAYQEEAVYTLPIAGSWRTRADRRRQLVTFLGRMANKKVTVLVDSGSTLDLISTDLARELGMHTDSSGAHKVRLADGRMQGCERTLDPLTLRVGPHRTTREFHATDLHTFDVILGKQWLAEYNPTVCWRTNEISLLEDGRVVKLTPSQPPRQSGMVGMVSYTQAKRDMKRGHDAWLGYLLPPEEMEGLHAVVEEEDAESEREIWQGTGEEVVPNHADPRMERVLRRHGKLFQTLRSLPPPGRPKHPIELEPGTQPQYRPAYRLSPEENDEILRQLEELLGLGFIRQSSSPWGAPVLFVRKKTGELRMCVDYRLLNSSTIKDRTPLPRIDELLDRVGTARYFSKLDLASGYWQVAIEEEAQPYTAFRTKYGSYEWLVMPFGLTNAPATFQKLMTHVLAGILDVFVLCYLDDLLIFSPTKEQHYADLDKVLTRLEEHKLHVKLSKCNFGEEEVEFLGHLVGAGRIKPDPSKLKTVSEWPTPKTPKDIRSFLGLAGYYRRFIPGFSRVAAPLHDLTALDAEWTWTRREEKAFTTIRDSLVSKPVLRLPTFDRPFTLTTDASTVAIAGVLEQPDDDGHLHPVAYCSRKLNVHESNYSSYDLEALAVVDAVTKRFRCYLEGRPFHLKTDHEALIYLQKQRDLNRRQARWVSELSPYSFTVEYRPGATNPADGPSRRPDYARALQIDKLQACGAKDDVDLRALKGTELAKLEGKEIFKFVPLDPLPKKQPKRRPTGGKVVSHLGPVVASGPGSQPADLGPSSPGSPPAVSGPPSPEEPLAGFGAPPPGRDPSAPGPSSPGRAPAGSSPNNQEGTGTDSPTFEPGTIREMVRSAYALDPLYTRALRSFHQEDGCFFFKERLAIPTHETMLPLRNYILQTCHDHMGHFASERTRQEVERNYWWPTIRSDVERYVKSCPVCQRTRLGQERRHGRLQPLQVPKAPFEHITMDLISLPPTEDGNDAAIVFVDRFSKYVILEPCNKTATAPQVADIFIKSVYSHFGLPVSIVSDRDTRFTAHYWRALFEDLAVKLKLSTPYHPQTDGQTERANRTLIAVLKGHALSREGVWDRTIKIAQAEMNAATNKSTGYSPFEVLHAYRPRFLPTMLRELITNVPAARQTMTSMMDVRKDVADRLEKASEAMIRQTNPRRVPVQFQPGELVLLSTDVINVPADLRKLEAPFCGPFKIVEVPTPLNVVLDLPDRYKNHRRVHVNHIRRYIEDPDFGDRYRPPDSVFIDEEEEWEVRAIRARRVHRNVVQYLVSYAGYDTFEDMWMPEDELPHCRELIDQFNHNTRRNSRQQNRPR